MSEFVYFTPQEKEAARNADIAEMLERQGERLKRSGSEYEWGEGSERVTIRGNLWYHQYEQKGGNAVSFVQKFMDKTYVEAMKFILGDGAGEIKQAEKKQAKTKEKKEFEPRKYSLPRIYSANLLPCSAAFNKYFSAFAASFPTSSPFR